MESRTRIKICGITNAEDARAAVDFGADALGFILVPESPRFIGGRERLGEVRAFMAELPPFVSRVAVCARADDLDTLWSSHFDTVQSYTSTTPGDELPLRRFVYAFRIQDANSLDALAAACSRSRPHAVLLDTYHKDKLGGSGETFNWDLAIEAKARFDLPIILAGGLTPDNVADAIEKVRPYAVDVSSGVEAEPGRKDHAKLRAFFRAVASANRSHGT